MIFKPTISLIAALGPDGLIGRKGGLIFHLPSDMKYFKKMTMGKPVVMGRKTYDSIPDKFKPLEGRQNIVLTRDKTWKAKGIQVIHKLDDMYQYTSLASEIMIIGGAEIYKMALPFANKMYITEIRDSMDSAVALSFRNFVRTTKVLQRFDVFFPIVPSEHKHEWKEVSRIPLPEKDFEADWVVYERV